MRISDWSSAGCSSDLAGDWENDIADAPGWIVDRSAGNLHQESLLAIDPLDVFRDIAHHLAFRARSDLMDRLDQQVDHRIRKLSFPRHQINGIEPELARRYMPAHLRGFLAGNPANDLIDPCLARDR